MTTDPVEMTGQSNGTCPFCREPTGTFHVDNRDFCVRCRCEKNPRPLHGDVWERRDSHRRFS